MKKNIDAQFLCKDCTRYNLCEYYHRRRKDSYICKYFHLSVTPPQEPQSFKWCTDCKEYDQEKHCCHRFSKVIRNTVEEMKQEPKTGHWIGKDGSSTNFYGKCSVCGQEFCLSAWYTQNMNYCPNCGADMREVEE